MDEKMEDSGRRGEEKFDCKENFKEIDENSDECDDISVSSARRKSDKENCLTKHEAGECRSSLSNSEDNLNKTMRLIESLTTTATVSTADEEKVCVNTILKETSSITHEASASSSTSSSNTVTKRIQTTQIGDRAEPICLSEVDTIFEPGALLNSANTAAASYDRRAAALRERQAATLGGVRGLCNLFCCPPTPGGIAAKVAFVPPEKSYEMIPKEVSEDSGDVEAEEFDEDLEGEKNNSEENLKKDDSQNATTSKSSQKSAKDNPKNLSKKRPKSGFWASLRRKKNKGSAKCPPLQLYYLSLVQSFEWTWGLRELHEHIEMFYANTKRGNKIACMSLRPVRDAKFTIIFSHGNAVDIGQMAAFFWAMGERMRVNVFGYDYSGYGESSGKPSEKNLYADIDAAHEALKRRYPDLTDDRIVLYGQSIGSVPTVDLASRNPNFAGVVLHGPLASGLRIFFPEQRKTCWFDVFRSIDKAHKVSMPTLIIHGTDDETIPIEHALFFYDKLPAPAEPLFVEGGGHNDIELFPTYHQRLKKFLQHDIEKQRVTGS